MKLASGQRIGQSPHELTIAVFFSFFLHAAVVALVLVIGMAITTRVYVPPSYSVKLVGLPRDLEQPAPQAPAQPVKPEVKPAASLPKREVPRPAPHKGAMPEFTSKPAKPSPQVQEQAEPAPAAKEAAPAGQAQGRTGVAVSAGSADPALSTYLGFVRNQIGRNWNPPPGAVGLKATIEFTINRSGVILNQPRLVAASGNFYFDQAAIRAIQQASPFPPMPEEFYRPTADFSVDLTPVN